MHMPSRPLVAAASVLLAVCKIQAQTLHGVGDLTGGITASEVRDATKTGGIIYAIGNSSANTSGPGDTSFIWNSSSNAITAIPDLVSNTTATNLITASDITPDAAYLAVRSRDDGTLNTRQAVRVTTSGLVLTNLGNPAGFTANSYGLAISDDGSVAYGVSTNALGRLQATRFEVGVGATAIAFAGGGDISSFATARGASSNGNLLLGTSATNTNVGGPGARAFLYDHNGGSPTVSLLPLLSGGTWSQGLEMNSAGTLALIGGNTGSNANGELYLVDSGNAVTALGTPNASWSLNSLAGMSADGAVVGMTWIDGAANRSYLYNTNGWQDFYAIAAASGATLTGWTELNLNGISDDGTLVWGDGLHNGNKEGFVMEFGAGYLASAAVPEPSAYAVFAGLGALGLAALRRRANA